MNTTNIYINTSHIPFAAIPERPYIYYSEYIHPHSVFAILTQVEEQLTSLRVAPDRKRRITGITIELFQNIYHHGLPGTIDNWKETASFRVENTEHEFVLTATSILHRNKISSLKKRLTTLNSYTTEKLNILYRDILKNENLVGEHAGLGLIDIYRKSGKPVLFKFTPKNNNYSLFTVTVFA